MLSNRFLNLLLLILGFFIVPVIIGKVFAQIDVSSCSGGGSYMYQKFTCEFHPNPECVPYYNAYFSPCGVGPSCQRIVKRTDICTTGVATCTFTYDIRTYGCSDCSGGSCTGGGPPPAVDTPTPTPCPAPVTRQKGETCGQDSLTACGAQQWCDSGLYCSNVGTFDGKYRCQAGCKNEGEVCGQDDPNNAFCCGNLSCFIQPPQTVRRCHSTATPTPTPTGGTVTPVPPPPPPISCSPAGVLCAILGSPVGGPCCAGLICSKDPTNPLFSRCTTGPTSTPTPTLPPGVPTPTPTPPGGGDDEEGESAGPWIKLKDTTFAGLSSFTNPIPETVTAYDSDDPGERYFITNTTGTPSRDPGVAQAQSLDLAQADVSLYNWLGTGSSATFSQKFSISTFVDYVKARKSYATISNVNDIQKGEINLITGTVTLDDNGFAGKDPFILIVEGDATIDKTNFNQGKDKIFAIMVTGTLNFTDKVREANGVFIGQTINTGTTTNQGLKVTGNLIAQGSLNNQRSWSDNSKPSLFIVFDPQYYMNLLPMLSVTSFDWKQLQ